jgi:ABC-type cobalamin transport system ATPase subunit
MASALNIFKTVTSEVTSSNTTIYTAPNGYTGIILMAQVTNITTTEGTVTVSTVDTSESAETELVKNFAIPGNDASSVITGKLVLEETDAVKIFANANNKFKVTLSVLESSNA